MIIMTIYLILNNTLIHSKTNAIIIDHRYTDISSISDKTIENTVKKLNIVYGHTSHGSQIMDGLRGLCNYDKRFSILPKIVDGSIFLKNQISNGETCRSNRARLNQSIIHTK